MNKRLSDDALRTKIVPLLSDLKRLESAKKSGAIAELCG